MRDSQLHLEASPHDEESRRGVVGRLSPTAEDEELIERALGGDRWAEEVLYRRHVPRVTRVTARLLRSTSDVEDTVQDAFIDAFRDLPSLRNRATFGPWVVKIAVNRSHNLIRRRRLRRFLGLERSLDDERLDLQARSHASQETRAQLRELGAVLDGLSAREQTCWVLRHLEGYQLTEVAELTQLSLATVKRKIASAHRAIEAHFGEVRNG